jgi:hypothetical protein
VPVAPNGAKAAEVADAIGNNALDDFQQKWPLHVADFGANGVIAGLAGKHASTLRKRADTLMLESEHAISRYGHHRGRYRLLHFTG